MDFTFDQVSGHFVAGAYLVKVTFAGYRMHRLYAPYSPKGVLENRMSGHRGWSRGCGCRLAKGLHGYRLVLPDVEDGI